MNSVTRNELLSSFENQLANSMQEQASTSQQVFNYEEVDYLNYNGGYTYEDFPYGNPRFQGQGTSSSNYQGQRKQPSFEESLFNLLNDIKKGKDSRLSNLETNKAKMSVSLKSLETN